MGLGPGSRFATRLRPRSRSGPIGSVRGPREDPPAAEPSRRVGAQLPGGPATDGIAASRSSRPDADTRELIVGADIVVGFQSTALYEAVAAGRPVIYAAWGEEYERSRHGLIPFDQAPPACIHHATSAAKLSQMFSEDLPPAGVTCTAWYEEALGPVDGLATDRVTRRLLTIAAASSPTPRRQELELRRTRYALALLARALAAQPCGRLRSGRERCRRISTSSASAAVGPTRNDGWQSPRFADVLIDPASGASSRRLRGRRDRAPTASGEQHRRRGRRVARGSAGARSRRHRESARRRRRG